jgi:hypothetical protein
MSIRVGVGSVTTSMATTLPCWGKTPQPHTGEDGENNIRFTIRHIVDGRDVEGRLIDGRSISLPHPKPRP